MITNQNLSRRDFVVTLSGFMTALTFTPDTLWAGQPQSLTLPTAVGEAYLKQFGQEKDLADLKTKIQNSVNTILEQQKALDEIREMIANDYLDDQTFEFDKWLLSKTEGRICALAALEQKPRSVISAS